MNLMKSLLLTGLICSLTPLAYAGVESSTKETVQDAKKKIKKGAHRVDEKACEMVNGKMQCLEKKVKNRTEEVKDEVKDMSQ